MTCQEYGQLGPLNIIIVEDSAVDAELVADALREAGLTVDMRRVDEEAALRAALDERLPDAILADWTLPRFSGRRALEIVRERWPDVPLIFVSGTISEASASDSLRQGAIDYVYKNQLQRLGPTLLRAIEEASMLSSLRESEEKYRVLFESSLDAIMTLEPPFWKFTSANPATVKMFGAKNEEEFISLGPCELSPDRQPDGRASVEKAKEMIDTAMREGAYFFEWTHRRIVGEEFFADVLLTRMEQRGKVLVQATIRDITERKLFDEALKTSEVRFRTAAENLTDVIYDWDIKEKVDWYGDIDGITGYPPEGFPRTIDAWAATIHPEDKDRVMAALEGHLKGLAPYTVEYRVKSRDGAWRWWSARGTALRDDKGDPIKMVGSVTDITERKQAEDARLTAEISFSTVFQASPISIAIARLKDGTYVDVNGAWEKVTGFTRDEAIGRKGVELNIWFDSSQRELLVRSMCERGAVQGFEVQMRQKSGAIRNLLISAEQIYFAGEPCMLSMAMDITERKQAEQDLKESKSLFEAVVENVPLMIFLKEATDLRFVIFNRAGEELLGYDRKELLGKNNLDLFPPEQAAHFIAKDREVLDGKAGMLDIPEESIETAKKGRRLLHTRKICILGNDGDTKYLLGISEDITERKHAEEEKSRLEAQLRHSQKMEAVGTLAGGVAHDFNNILNVIMGYGSMVYDGIEAGSLAKEQMNEVLIAADRAANLTKRLLVFSRKNVLEVKPVNINALILGMQKMLDRLIREDIDFTVELADRPLIVPADTGLIEQVLMNLATNAKDAMQEGGRLTIGTGVEEINNDYVAAYGYGKPGSYAIITVADTGHGIDAESQKKIFEPFFTTKGIGEGTGLGLAISYGIIKQHGGFINVYSKPGHGTVFKIYLPLSDEATSPKLMTEVDAPVKGGNETVLVAEDDASLREVTRIILESFGYTVISAVDGEDAITKFMENRERISLALIDMIMPKKNGKEAGEAMRKVSPRIKILYESGYSMDIIKTDELTEYAADFIHKPFPPRDLLIKVREILDR